MEREEEMEAFAKLAPISKGQEGSKFDQNKKIEVFQHVSVMFRFQYHE